MKLARVIRTCPAGFIVRGNPIPLDSADFWARESCKSGTTRTVEIIENPTKEDYTNANSYLDTVSRGINLLLSHPESHIMKAHRHKGDNSGSPPTHDSLHTAHTYITLMKNVISFHK
jgi:hypothetical protein